MTAPTPDPVVTGWLTKLNAATPADIQLRVTNLEAQQTTTTISVAALAQMVDNLGGRMSATDDKIAAIQAELGTVTSNIGNVAGDVQGLQAEVQSLKDQLAAIDPALAAKLQPLEDQVNALAASTQALADSVPDAPPAEPTP